MVVPVVAQTRMTVVAVVGHVVGSVLVIGTIRHLEAVRRTKYVAETLHHGGSKFLFVTLCRALFTSYFSPLSFFLIIIMFSTNTFLIV